MTPDKEYNGRSKIRMYRADCMELMKSGKKWDLAIVDPPYGIDIGNGLGSGRHKFTGHKKWQMLAPSDDFWELLNTISENKIIWGGNNFNLPICDNWIIWDKMNPNLSFGEAEMAWCSIKRKIRIFKYYSAQVPAGGKIHPTQKPVQLYKWLLTNYAKEGDTILDSHGGSMSIAIACWDLGFDLDICELDKDYFDAAVKRFESHISQQVLF